MDKMKIKNVYYAAGLTGFFFDDQRAIKRGAEHTVDVRREAGGC